MLDWAMARPEFKTQLFRFVDVFPALADNDDVAGHLVEYFEGVPVPRVLDLGVDVAGHVPFGRAIEARVARRNILRMAEQFIVGQTSVEAVDGLHRLWRSGSAATVDLLGEKTIVDAEADRYAARVDELVRALAAASAHWAPDDHLERDDLGVIPRINVSIKPTALAAHYEPLTRAIGLERAKERIRPLLALARDKGAFVHFDMEHFDAKDLTLQLFRELLTEPDHADLEAGIVVQAYTKGSRNDLADLIAFSASRTKPITVRLVKGAYWDTETVHARAAGWPVPVYERKAETDANFERCVRLLHDHHGEVRAAFATHNLRSLAYAIAYARSKGIPDTGFEVQMLYGMAEPMQAAVRRSGLRLRVYAPVGELVPGMAYLVRRLLENTSNESFVRHRFVEERELDELLAAPEVDTLPVPGAAMSRPTTDAVAPTPYEPEPVAEWRQPAARASFAVAVDAVGGASALDVPALIDGERVWTSTTIDSVDPGRFDRVIARSAACDVTHADAAVAAASARVERWRSTPVAERAGVLFRAAAWMRSNRNQLAAIEVFECGKPWDQADADVCEAIDFCEYYGRGMLRLEGEAASRVQSPPGERNRLTYQGKGVAAVIAPWNFPLAIPCGMTAAALVAGNPVILKPAEQSPGIAWQLVEAFAAAGLPEGVLQFLPGYGEAVGARLVEHPEVAVIAFTGSKAVGLHINDVAAITRPGQRHIKRVIAEMGGKNALVIDSDADPDEAVPAVITSSFGYAGQKCSAASRVIVVDRVYEQFVPRLAAATAEVIVGHPSNMATQVGPVIDADAHHRLSMAIEKASADGSVIARQDDIPAGGWYVAPTMVAVDHPDATIARDELFGPVVAVLRARDFDHAIELANDTDYALTAGLFSRSPVHIDRAARVVAGGQRLHQPRHDRRGRRTPTVRRVRALRRRLEGRRPRLPAAIPRPARDHGEHRAPRFCGRHVTENTPITVPVASDPVTSNPRPRLLLPPRRPGRRPSPGPCSSAEPPGRLHRAGLGRARRRRLVPGVAQHHHRRSVAAGLDADGVGRRRRPHDPRRRHRCRGCRRRAPHRTARSLDQDRAADQWRDRGDHRARQHGRRRLEGARHQSRVRHPVGRRESGDRHRSLHGGHRRPRHAGGRTARADELFVTAPVAATARSSRGARDTVWFPILVFVGIALVLFVTVEVSHDHFSAEHEPAAGALPTQGHWYSGWLQFDAAWYVYIAEHGYDAQQKAAFDSGQQSAIAYFPAYPLTVRAVAAITGYEDGGVAMLTTFSCGLAFALLFWYWCRDRMSRRARRTALVLLLVYPYAWFLYGSGYGDALFLAVTVAAFLFLEHDHPVLAGVAGFVALAARPTGTAVFIGLVAVALEHRGVVTRDAEPAAVDGGLWGRERSRWHLHRGRLRRGDAGVLLAFGGLASYVFFCATQYGDPFAFATVQKAPGWDQGAGLHTWLKIGFFGHLVHGSPAYSVRLLAEAVLALAFLLGAYLVLRRFGWSYALYSLAIVAVPMFGTGDFQGMGRYILGCFPVFAAVGDWLATPRREVLRAATVFISFLALVMLASLFGRSYYLT